MLRTASLTGYLLLPLLYLATSAQHAWSQPFGLELHNTLMSASGGMGGASIALPQDVTSAINANPATLTQFQGTQFLFGGAWIEPTYNLQHDRSAGLPNVGSFQAKSEDQGLGDITIGVTRDLDSLGVPATLGLGFNAIAGGGTGFRDVPESNGFDNLLIVFGYQMAAGVELTERLSVGGRATLGIGIFDGPFLGATTATYDYALRGSVGIDYEVNQATNLGFYWQTKQSFVFDDAVRLDLGRNLDVSEDIRLGLPENIGLGIANRHLMSGDLLLAADVTYKQWSGVELFDALYVDQWVFQLGAQLTRGRFRYRVGYAFAENPINPDPGVSAGGITPPGEENAIRFAQGGVAIINQHRLTLGMGIRNLLSGMDFDLFAGGMPRTADDLGEFTSVNVESYWIGMGVTYRCSQGSCRGCDSEI